VKNHAQLWPKRPSVRADRPTTYPQNWRMLLKQPLAIGPWDRHNARNSSRAGGGFQFRTPVKIYGVLSCILRVKMPLSCMHGHVGLGTARKRRAFLTLLGQYAANFSAGADGSSSFGRENWACAGLRANTASRFPAKFFSVAAGTR
jgi:hypothetical protein